MNRLAIFIDSGYFFSGGSMAAFGQPVPRATLAVRSVPEMTAGLFRAARSLAYNDDVLRAYWYDALIGPRPTPEQQALAVQAGIKLRLGSMHGLGYQKVVDNMLSTDLIELARHRAISDAVVLSSNEDLSMAIEMAQSLGVRVHVMAAGDTQRNLSLNLQMAADSVGSLDAAWFAAHLQRNESAVNAGVPALSPQAAPEGASLEDVALLVCDELLDALDAEQLRSLETHFATSSTVPPEYDRKLIATVATRLGGVRLGTDQMRTVRSVLAREVRRLAA